MPVSFDDLATAVEYVSSSHEFENIVLLCKQTGKTYYSSNFDLKFDEFPRDSEDPDKYVCVPSRRDLKLGRRTVSEFAGAHMPDDWDRIESIFSRKGAYRRFKDFLAERNMLDAWHEFEDRRLKEAIHRWAESEGVEVVEDAAG